MQLSVIIPTKDRDSIFAETLISAISAVAHLQAEIIVVNDSKSSIPKIPESATNVKLLNNPKSGVASARNLGAKNAVGDLLLFLDNDILISRQSVDHVLTLHKQRTDVAINLNWVYSPSVQQTLSNNNFGRFLEAHRLTSFKGWYNEPSWQDDTLFASSSVASFHLSLSRSNFERTGGYAEEFPHSGFEDYDFPKRLKKNGVAFYIDSRVSVYHNETDRLGIENWLLNQERRAITRKVAVNLGYKELELKYGLLKRLLLTVLNYFYSLHLALLKGWPGYKIFDVLYFKWVGGILAARIYKGYISK